MYTVPPPPPPTYLDPEHIIGGGGAVWRGETYVITYHILDP